MQFLVTGANGFIGSAVVEKLLAEGHRVVAVGRSVVPSEHDQIRHVRQNLSLLTTPQDWALHLEGVDGVINCAGILRTNSPREYEVIHIDAPLALAKACNEKGINKFVQISALGDPEDGEFIASKHRFDEELLQLIPSATVLRPSVVVSLRGSYGGTSMLRGLAAFPEFLLLPGKGEQKIQPILLEDLAALVSEALSENLNANGLYEVGGPEQLTIKEYLLGLRDWLNVTTKATIHIPNLLIKTACIVGDKVKAGPLNRTILRLLESGNIVHRHSATGTFSYKPTSVLNAFTSQTSFVQDRWHAKLFLLQPLVWFLLCVIWFVSALAGFCADEEAFTPILLAAGFPNAMHFSLVMLTSILDLVLGCMLMLRFKERLTLWLMLLSTLGYILMLGVLAPELWLDPLGGLLKNLAVAPLLLVYMVMRNAR